MAGCRKAISHCLSQYLPRSMTLGHSEHSFANIILPSGTDGHRFSRPAVCPSVRPPRTELSMGPSGTNFSEILIRVKHLSISDIVLKFPVLDQVFRIPRKIFMMVWGQV